MVEGYRKFRNLRKSSYSLLIGGTNFTTWIPEYIPESNYSNAKKCVQIVQSLSYDMVMEYFEPFSTLSSQDQKTVFANFLMFFGNTEKLYNTCKAFGNVKDNDKIILGDGGYGKLGEISKCYTNSADVNGDPEELAKIFSTSMTYSVKVIVPAMMKAEIDDYTITAIYAISLFNDLLADITVESREILKKAKEGTIKDLHAYFCKKGLSDVELTLAVSRVLLLLPTLEQYVKRIRENFHLLDVFHMIDLPHFYKHMSIN
uniref:NR LBD domain-containing protein n=1 Tax=Panagrolaimus sp. PS1159 TaxID=55785 RepID=A0AC35GFX1_9BILA